MLYIFRIRGERWIKFGYTATSAWDRARRGFYTNAHPTELCNNLHKLLLLATYEGDLTLESHVKQHLPPDHCEFWKLHGLPDIMCFLNQITKEILNPWTQIQPEPTPTEKMPCCGGMGNKELHVHHLGLKELHVLGLLPGKAEEPHLTSNGDRTQVTLHLRSLCLRAIHKGNHCKVLKHCLML